MSSRKRKEGGKGMSSLEEPEDKKRKCSDDSDSFLSSVTGYILKAGIQKVRLQIFENQLKKFGGILSAELNSSVTHLIVDDNMDIDRLCKILKLDLPPDNVVIVKTSWLSACFKEKQFVDEEGYILDVSKFKKKSEEKQTADVTETGPDTSYQSQMPAEVKSDLPKVGMMFGYHGSKVNPRKTESDNDSDYCPSDEEAGTSNMSDPDETSAKPELVGPVQNLPVKSC